MIPAARLQAAAEILDRFAASSEAGADRLLKEWGRASRFAGSKDRAAVADRVYDCLRRWRSLGAVLGETGRGRVLAGLVADGGLDALDALDFTARHAPAPPDEAERARLEALARDGLDALIAAEGASEALRSDWPDWLWPELARLDDPAAEADRLRVRAAFDLRVNTLKTDVATAAALLAEEGVETEPAPLSPIGLRVQGKARILNRAAYQEGLVEPQDVASQAAALLTAALLNGVEVGWTALDYCAGGGGKTLALAAALGGGGRLIAHDVAPQRMKDLSDRLGRAGAEAEILPTADLAALKAGCDLVLVDAPCSGSGAWARNPDAKWRLTPVRLEALGAAQDQALDQAASLARPGGVLVYATCSLLPRENGDRIAGFLERSPDFHSEPLTAVWAAAGLLGAPPESDAAGGIALTPMRQGADGFYVAAMRRSA